jgi:hypothetical protein
VGAEANMSPLIVALAVVDALTQVTTVGDLVAFCNCAYLGG